VGIEVEATGALDIFVVPASQIEQWRRGSNYAGDSFMRRKNLQVKLRGTEFEDGWYLVLD